MRIKWLGHACFLLASGSGKIIVTDPFDKKIGYPAPAVKADIVTTSHEHYDHNNISMIKGDFLHIDKPGVFSKDGIIITGIPTFHDGYQGAKRGSNIIFKFVIDGIKICHCGDLGHALTPEQELEIGEVDILLVPVGGTYTINSVGAVEIIKQLKPVLTIPMHFKTDALNFYLDGVNKFLAAAGNGKIMDKQEIVVEKGNLHEFEGVIVLDYK